MGINIANISYLSFRLAPLIIVSFFILQSLFNWDLKGIIYLAGLLLCTVSIIFVNGTMTSFFPKNDVFVRDAKCSIISLGNDGEILSNTPLSIGVYSFTFFYMLIFILNLGNRSDNKGMTGELNSSDVSAALKQNVPILILFPLLCIFEIFWIMLYNCVWDPVYYITSSLIIGGIWGVSWGIIITQIKRNDLMYLSKSGVDVCSRPQKTYFSCRPAANGSKTKTSSGPAS